MADKLKITSLDLDTYFGDRFMPTLQDQKFYFDHPFEPNYKMKLYQPNMPYTYYGIPALGGINNLGQGEAAGVGIFKDLANIGISLYSQEQQIKEIKNQQKAHQEAERLKAEAILALNKERLNAPIVIQGASSPLLPILAGTAFLATVGGIMYFLSVKK